MSSQPITASLAPFASTTPAHPVVVCRHREAKCPSNGRLANSGPFFLSQKGDPMTGQQPHLAPHTNHSNGLKTAEGKSRCRNVVREAASSASAVPAVSIASGAAAIRLQKGIYETNPSYANKIGLTRMVSAICMKWWFSENEPPNSSVGPKWNVPSGGDPYVPPPATQRN
jgi:hypothetical protein